MIRMSSKLNDIATDNPVKLRELKARLRKIFLREVSSILLIIREGLTGYWQCLDTRHRGLTTEALRHGGHKVFFRGFEQKISVSSVSARRCGKTHSVTQNLSVIWFIQARRFRSR